MLTNRKTTQQHDASGKKLTTSLASKTATLFAEPTYTEQVAFLLTSVPEALREDVSNMLLEQADVDMSLEEKIRRAKVIAKLCQQPKIITFLCDMNNDPDKIEETLSALRKKMTDIETQLKSKLQEEPSFLSHFMTTVGLASLNHLFPGVGLLLLSQPIAAAASTGIFSGIPAGGSDFCFGNTLDCIQGFIAEAGNSSNWFGQFSRQVELAVSGGKIDTSFATCLSVDRVGETVTTFFEAMANGTSTNDTISCIANSRIINDTIAIVKANNLNLPNQHCAPFSAGLNALYEICRNFTDPGKAIPPGNPAAYIAGGVIGGVLLIALATLAICVCKKRLTRTYAEV